MQQQTMSLEKTIYSNKRKTWPRVTSVRKMASELLEVKVHGASFFTIKQKKKEKKGKKKQEKEEK